MPSTFIYYHTDLDGACSAAIARRGICSRGPVILHPISYGYDVSVFDEVVDEDDVVFVDFTPEFCDVEAFLNRGCEVTILDHHKKAFDNYCTWVGEEDEWVESVLSSGQLAVVYDLEKAGCQIAWEFYNHSAKPMPEAVELAALYDIWKHDNPRVIPFQYGMALVECDPGTEEGSKLWDMLLAPEVEEDGVIMVSQAVDQIIGMGDVALAYKRAQDKRAMRSGQTYEIAGKTFFVVNAQLADSYAFDEAVYDKEVVDGLAWYYYNGKTGMWHFSLRSAPNKPDTDVNEVAKRFGGGGHPGSAGLKVARLEEILI